MRTPVSARQRGQHYAIFGFCVRSFFPLPELRRSSDETPRITVRKVECGQLDLEHFVVQHDWRRRGLAPICSSARRGEDYLLSFPGRARFLITSDGLISCLPGDEKVVRDLLLRQVLPRALGHSGEFLLHASAVTLPSGNTVAFLGDTGRGKSTLATYCYRQGAEIVDDDCVHVCFEGERIGISGGVPTIRLSLDAQRALVDPRQVSVPVPDSSGKQQLRMLDQDARQSEPRKLDALFLLAPPAQGGVADTVRIEAAPGTTALMAVVSSAFNLDPADTDTMRRNFLQAGRLLDEGKGLRLQLLHYPRRYDCLEQVWTALMRYFGG